MSNRLKNASKTAALNAAEKVLKNLNPPKAMKYHQIATIAISEGWSHAGKTNPEVIMYAALKEAISLNDPRFYSHGRGYFSLLEHCIMDNELPLPVAIKRLGRKNQQRLEQIEVLNKKCGNCQFIVFNGIKEVTLEGGICLNEESNRCGVKYESASCPLWVERSASQIEKDFLRQSELKTALDGLANKHSGRKIKRKEESLT